LTANRWLWLALAVIFLLFLYSVRSILTPFILAAITAYVLHPAASWLEGRLSVPHRYAAIVLFAALLSGLALLLLVLVPILAHQAAQLVREIPRSLAQIRAYLAAYDTLEILGIPVDVRLLQRSIDNLMVEVANIAGREAIPAVFHAAEILIKTFIYLVTTFYLLLQGRELIRWAVDLFPNKVQPDLKFLLARINRTLTFYVTGQVMLIGIMSIATTIALSVFQVRYALLLGITTGILETIPIVGPFTAGTFAVLVALFQQSTPFGWTPLTLAAVVALVYFVLRQTEDNLVIPLLIGRMVDLHPVVVIFSAMAGATIGGLLGLLLAIPTAAVVKILVEYGFPKLTGRMDSSPLRATDGDRLSSFLKRLWELPAPDVLIVVPASALPELNTPQGIAAFVETVKALNLRPAFATDHPALKAIANRYGWPIVQVASHD
jgi:predicted PurR-regulated permease PerM